MMPDQTEPEGRDDWDEAEDSMDEPWPCPMGCGRTTDDVAGGPCTACWDQAPGA